MEARVVILWLFIALQACYSLSDAGTGEEGNSTVDVRTMLEQGQPKGSYYSLAATAGGAGNVIDACWLRGSDWRANRMRLADCAVGFGAGASGGRGGNFYLVTDPSDDPVQPRPGTLRFGVTRLGPLWITFKGDMTIRLKAELLVTSFKTIDARGADVRIGMGGPCLTLQYVNHVIIHGLSLTGCRPSSPGRVITSSDHTGFRNGADGDAISIFSSNNVWVDHCLLSDSSDGLIDAIQGSTAITISNNFFFRQDKVMLFGAKDNFPPDRNMRITVLYNRFQDCVQRMPRGRQGYFHVANNEYESWGNYAIGGSDNPTFFSEANRFIASVKKRVTKSEGGNENPLWTSRGDLFLNGAFFLATGDGDSTPRYSRSESFPVRPATMVPVLTAKVGPLKLR